jgi:hypothetical protein
MAAVELLVGLQMDMNAGIVIALLLAAALLVPYLIREISKGKKERVRAPIGASEVRPGRRGNPAPGHPEAQADPYDSRAQR